MPHRRSILGPLAAAALTLAACSAPGASTSATPSATTSSTAARDTPSVASSASPSASVAEGPPASAAPEPSEDELGPFSCDLPVDGSGTAPRAQITDVRVAEHDGYDRIVFEFVGAGDVDAVPAYSVELAEPPFMADPSGLPVEVRGDAFLGIFLFGGTKISPVGGITYGGPTDFDARLPALDQLVESGDFEAVSTWIAGMHAGDGCYRVLTLTNPSRLVIDIEH